jgi:peptidoglycan/LPS O-acetylase OafA/YrhL
MRHKPPARRALLEFDYHSEAQLMETSEPMDRKGFTGIEIGRFLCAFAVILWHYQTFFQTGVEGGGNEAPADTINYPFYSVLSFFYLNGHHAVVIFWMISGFIFFWKYGSDLHERKVSTYDFFMLRFSRLYPLHFATLILVAILQVLYISSHRDYFIYAHNDAPHFLLQLVFASNWLGSQPFTFNGSIWSVSVEVLAYAFFFLMVRFFRPGLILCLVVAVVFKTLDHFQPQSLFVCIEYFFIGGAVVRLIEKLNRTQSRIAFWLCAVGIVAIGATRLGSGTVVIFAFCCLTAFALLNEAVGSRFERVSKLGDLTYASYLIHFPIQLALVLVVDWLGISRAVFLSPVALIAFIVVTFALSWVVFHGFEMPAQRRIRALALPREKRAPVREPEILVNRAE